MKLNIVLKNKRIAFIPLFLLSFSSCDSSKVPGLENFYAGVNQSNLFVSFLSTKLRWGGGLSGPIPGLEGAEFSAAPSVDSKKPGTLFQFSVPLKSLIQQDFFSDESGLPDGRPLPDIAGGILPRWDIEIGQYTLHLYISPEAFAVFFPIPLISKQGVSLPFQVSLPIKDDRGNLIGKSYAIPSNAKGEGSGVLILIPFVGSTASPPNP